MRRCRTRVGLTVSVQLERLPPVMTTQTIHALQKTLPNYLYQCANNRLKLVQGFGIRQQTFAAQHRRNTFRRGRHSQPVLIPRLALAWLKVSTMSSENAVGCGENCTSWSYDNDLGKRARKLTRFCLTSMTGCFQGLHKEVLCSRKGPSFRPPTKRSCPTQTSSIGQQPTSAPKPS